MTCLGDRILKVNHAGENGAIAIYSAQIAIAKVTAPGIRVELMAFRQHERTHRSIFAAELARRGVPRCRSYWLCGFGGWMLGLLTGLMGKSAIAATTVAVESVVLRHLERQIALLGSSDPEATAAIRAIVADEQLHHDASASHEGEHSAWGRVIKPMVAASTEAVIWLGMRI